MRALDNEAKSLHKNNIRLQIIGDISRFSTRLQERIASVEALTANNTGLVLNVAANYGGRWDIVQATRQIAAQVQEGKLHTDDIDETLLSKVICMGINLQ